MDTHLITYDLPHAVGHFNWTLQPHRAAVLIHDMQLHFLQHYQPHGLIGTIIRNTHNILDWAEANSIPLFYSAQGLQTDTKARGLLTHRWGPGLQDPKLEKIHPDLERPGYHIHKHRYSAFFHTNFEKWLEHEGRDQLIITGVYANIGCAATATDAYMRNIELFFVEDAVADFGYEFHQRALDTVGYNCGRIIQTKEILCTAS